MSVPSVHHAHMTISGIPKPSISTLINATDLENQERGQRIEKESTEKLDFRYVKSIAEWYTIEGEVIPSNNAINWTKPVVFAKMKKVPPPCLKSTAIENDLLDRASVKQKSNSRVVKGIRAYTSHGSGLKTITTAPGSLAEMDKKSGVLGSARSSLKGLVGRISSTISGKKVKANKGAGDEDVASVGSTCVGTASTSAAPTPMGSSMAYAGMRMHPSSSSPVLTESELMTRPGSRVSGAMTPSSEGGLSQFYDQPSNMTITESGFSGDSRSPGSKDQIIFVEGQAPVLTETVLKKICSTWRLPALNGQVVIKVRHKVKGFKDETEHRAWLRTMKIMYYISGGLSCNCNQISNLLDIVQDDSFYYAVMEYVRGRDLFDFFMDEKPHKKSYVAKLGRQMAISTLNSVAELHYYGLVHRDLKLENLVLDEANGQQKGEELTAVVKIIDFDTIEVAVPGKKVRHVLGTDQYIAPECYLGYPSPAADIFGVGVVLYTLMSGTFPYHSSLFDDKPGENVVGNPKMAQIRSRIVHAEINFSDAVWNEVPQTRAFVVDCMHTDASKRPTAGELSREHCWFSPTQEMSV